MEIPQGISSQRKQKRWRKIPEDIWCWCAYTMLQICRRHVDGLYPFLSGAIYCLSVLSRASDLLAVWCNSFYFLVLLAVHLLTREVHEVAFSVRILWWSSYLQSIWPMLQWSLHLRSFCWILCLLNEWLDLFNVFFRILVRDCSETCSCRYLPYCMLQLHNEIWLC
jgi:hypothetical protein